MENEFDDYDEDEDDDNDDDDDLVSAGENFQFSSQHTDSLDFLSSVTWSDPILRRNWCLSLQSQTGYRRASQMFGFTI